MSSSRPILCAAVLVIAWVLPACSHRTPAHPAAANATLFLDQSSFRMLLPVDRGGRIHLSDQTPFQGRLDASPILRMERSRVETLQVMIDLGRFYVMGEGFGHLWEVAPVGGTRTASYRSIPLPRGSFAKARLSRYGPADRACLRLESDTGPPWFLGADGTFHDRCP